MAFRRPSLSPTGWYTIERVTQQVLWIALFAVLAPILGPRPYGLFSIVMVFIGFSDLILIDSTSEALITVDALDHLHTTTANLANCAIALGCAIVMSALAPVAGMVFHDDEITRLIWALAPLPLLAALSAIPIAVLRRSMRYKQLAIRSIVGLMIGGMCGIAVAFAGGGVWALALQALAQRLAEVIIVWISAPVRLGVRWSSRHFNEMRPVGMNVFAARIMIFVSGYVPRVILGYAVGPTELGLFSLASRFLDIILTTTVQPRSTVGRTELPRWQPGSPEFTATFARIVQDASVLSFPLFLGTAALAPDLFRVWLGERWLPGIASTQLMMIGGLPFVFFYCMDAALLAANLSSVFRGLAIVQAVTIVATVLCAAPFGLNATCLALAIRAWVLLPFFMVLARRLCHLPIYSFLRLPLLFLMAAVAMAALLALPLLRTLRLRPEIDLVFCVLLGLIVYGGIVGSVSRGQLKALLAGFFVSRS